MHADVSQQILSDFLTRELCYKSRNTNNKNEMKEEEKKKQSNNK